MWGTLFRGGGEMTVSGSYTSLVLRMPDTDVFTEDGRGRQRVRDVEGPKDFGSLGMGKCPVHSSHRPRRGLAPNPARNLTRNPQEGRP